MVARNKSAQCGSASNVGKGARMADAYKELHEISTL